MVLKSKEGISAKKNEPLKKTVALISVPQRKKRGLSTVPKVSSKDKLKRTKKVRTEVTRNSHTKLQLPVVEQEGSRKMKVAIHNNTTLQKSNTIKPVVSVTSLPSLQGGDVSIQKSLTRRILKHIPSVPAIQSPFRSPLITPMAMSTFARTMGVCFMLLGGIFSLIHLNTISVSGESQVGTLEIGYMNGGSGTSSSGSGFTNDIPASPPSVTFSVSEDGDLNDRVDVIVSVSNAQGVALSAYNLQEGRMYSLNIAIQMNANTWKYQWETTDVPNGTYKLVAIVHVLGASHVINDTALHEVRNEVVIATGEVDGETEGTNTPNSVGEGGEENGVDNVDTEESEEVQSTTTEISVSQKVTLSVHSNNTSADTLQFTITAPGATGVKLYAKNKDTLLSYYLGSAVFIDVGWSLIWKTNQVVSGNYIITAKALIDGAYYEDVLSRVAVTHEVKPLSLASTTKKVDKSLPTLVPTATLSLSKQNPVEGNVDVFLTTSSGVIWLEVYARNKNSLTPSFLGLAQRKSDTEWKYVWQTAQIPNGEYVVYSRMKTEYGFTEGSSVNVVVANEVKHRLTEAQENEIDAIHDTQEKLVKITSNQEEIDETDEGEEIVYIKPVAIFVESLDTIPERKNEIRDELDAYGQKLEEALRDLAVAERKGDAVALAEAQNAIEELKNTTLKTFEGESADSDRSPEVATYLRELTSQKQEITLKNEKIIRERLGADVERDSDRDSISDYDELHLYRTDPYVADTDNDGFVDSVEITSGFNPLDAKSEALVTYESPKEKGIEREDLLTVTSISTLTTETASGTKMALIQGTALPHSFITLYIFSTPIIVTVKTDDVGNWSYIFDKELDDGSHEVYIGMTDNAGRIVAKSSVLPFIKTAEAYVTHDIGTPEAVVLRAEPSLVGGSGMLLVASIAVVALGLILILIGFHLTPAHLKEEYGVAT